MNVCGVAGGSDESDCTQDKYRFPGSASFALPLRERPPTLSSPEWGEEYRRTIETARAHSVININERRSACWMIICGNILDHVESRVADPDPVGIHIT